MWNLSALADKAKEAAEQAKQAAARIERQLDESTGIDTNNTANDTGVGVLGGIIGRTSTTATNIETTTHDDLDDDDDFFTDDSNAVLSHNSNDQDVVDSTLDSAPIAATKLDITADEGDDFFGDDDDSRQPPQHQVSEEIDFGGGDGWNEDVELDDDEQVNNEEISPSLQQQQQEEEEQLQAAIKASMIEMEQQQQQKVDQIDDEVHEKEEIVMPEQPQTEQSIEEEAVIEEVNHVDQAPNDQKDEIIQSEPEPDNVDIEEQSENIAIVESEQPLEEPIVEQPQESIHTRDTSDDIVMEAESVQQGDNISPANDVVMEADSVQQKDNDDSPSVDDVNPESQLQNGAPSSSVGDAEKQQYLATIAQLESQLYQREDQLSSKSDQITSLSMQYEAETTQLRQVISETKEEAKKRILRAKDRVEEMQTKLTDAARRADAAGGSSQGQSDIIAALRAEGEQLARKQSTMEQSVRSAKGEARELQEKLDIEMEAREKEVAKVESLEKEVKSLNDELSSARKGETLSKKLEGELVAAKEESEKQRASNLDINQQLKEIKEERKELKKEVAEARAGAALELEGESNKLRRERDDMLSDLESKLHTSEREANVREDALRHEVSELRKRWQDSVRRAEDLSMDVQQSTAPLLRQLESTERQNRARATAWAEMETKLRADLEENVIRLEKLTKERNDLVTSDRKSLRLVKEKEENFLSSQETIEELSTTIETLETKVEDLEEEKKNIKQELVLAERKAAEGSSKVRTEMLQTVVDSEARYQRQIEVLEDELDGEKQRRGVLEKELDDLAESVKAAEFAESDHARVGNGNITSPAQQKTLRSATNQASILHDTLAGFDSEVDDDDEDDERDENGMDHMIERQGSSFAAMEQLAQGLKGAKVELEALRKQLASSEETRASLLEELGEARSAVEKLPLFEQKVADLTMEVKMKVDEIQCLQDDIADVRLLYRTQLDSLLEEKAATPVKTPPPRTSLEEDEGVVSKPPSIIIDGWED